MKFYIQISFPELENIISEDAEYEELRNPSGYDLIDSNNQILDKDEVIWAVYEGDETAKDIQNLVDLTHNYNDINVVEELPV